jgi:hypothetical protein
MVAPPRRVARARGQPSHPEQHHIEPATNQTYTVSAYAGSPAVSFKYADPATASQVTDTFASTDVFTVDGVPATFGAFMASLSVGDVVTILANTPTTGVTTYQLVNKTAADYVSGLVGPVDTSEAAHPTYSIIDPITGTKLSGDIAYDGANTVYTLNGAVSTLAAISLAINEGDTIVSTGTGADATHIRTIALTNITVTGTVATPVVGDNGATPPVITYAEFFVKTAAGATLGDIPTKHTNDTVGYAVYPTDTFTVDGVASTLAIFGANLSAGDTISYSRAADVQTVALVNANPAPVTGIVAGGSTLSDLFYFVGSSAVVAGPFDLHTGYTYILNGSVATLAEVNAAITGWRHREGSGRQRSHCDAHGQLTERPDRQRGRSHNPDVRSQRGRRGAGHVRLHGSHLLRGQHLGNVLRRRRVQDAGAVQQ